MLKLRRDIDAGKTGIAGHSQGGWIAPLAAARSGDVAFVTVNGAAAIILCLLIFRGPPTYYRLSKETYLTLS